MKKAAPAILSLLIFLVFVPLSANAQGVTHTLLKGETLYAVSRTYKVPYEALAAANGITDPTKVKVGTVLVIPSVHLAAKGETLYGIARQYGISLGQLLSANKLGSGYVLKIGDSLIIPAGGKVEAPASTAAVATPITLAPPASTATAPTATPATTPSTTPVPPPTSVAKTNGSGTTASTKAPATTLSLPTAVQAPGSTSSTLAATQGAQTTVPPKQSGPVQLPEPLRTQDRIVDASLKWPVLGKVMYLDGKLEGIMIRVKPGESAKSIAAGTVVSAGPSRGFSQVVFVQAKSGYVYVYGGIEAISVKTGDHLVSGSEIGKIGIDAKDGAPIAYFFVFRNGQPIDPAAAPRD